MKKYFLIMSACLLLVFYHLIPADAPSSDVWEWLASSVGALAVLYYLFHSLGWEKTDASDGHSTRPAQEAWSQVRKGVNRRATTAEGVLRLAQVI